MTDEGKVIFSVEDGEVKLTAIRQSIKRAQQLYRRYVTSDVNVDDFIVERGADAIREDDA